MKRLFAVLLVLVAILAFSACTKKNNPAETTGTPGSTTTVPEQTTQPDGTTAPPEQTTTPPDTTVDPSCTNHTYSDWSVTKEPGCETTGEKQRQCSNCGTVEKATVDAKGHTEVKVSGRAATCTSSGLTEGSKCSACGKVLKKQETTAVKGHKKTTLAGKAATCTESGLTEGSKCSTCEIIIKAQTTIPAKGHTSVAVAAKDPTCQEAGLTEGTKCSTCGTVLKPQQTVAAKGHTEVVITGKAATCGETGLTDGKICAFCGEIIVAQEIIPSLEHTYGEWYTYQEATCAQAGWLRQECSVCGDYIEEAIAATGEHNYVAGVCTGCGDQIVGSTCLTYELSSDGTYYICTGTTTVTPQQELIIPSYYNGKPVKQVGNGNPQFCDTYKLTIMEGVERITESTFYLNKKLEEVHLPSTLTYIGNGAFNWCDNLKSVYVNTSGWQQINKYVGTQESVDFSNPTQVAQLLRTSSSNYYQR